MVGLIAVVAYAKQMTRLPEQIGVPAAPGLSEAPQKPLPPLPVGTPDNWVQPDVTTLPAPLDVVAPPRPQTSPEQAYARNKVSASAQQLINDIFPSEETIGKIVVAFKEQFPGPNKQSDVEILYNAIMYNPEIRKFVTLENTVPVYKFVTDAINKAWDKHDNWIWSR
jgi:hypothetical protein